jgi:hypothetical protein
MGAIDQGLVDLVINIPIEYDEFGRPDGYHIRRRAVDAGIPLKAASSSLGSAAAWSPVAQRSGRGAPGRRFLG